MSAQVPAAETILVKLWSSPSSGSRLRSVQSRHGFGTRALRTGSLLGVWSLVAVRRQDHQRRRLQPPEGARGGTLPRRRGRQAPLAAHTQGLCPDRGAGRLAAGRRPLENSCTGMCLS